MMTMNRISSAAAAMALLLLQLDSSDAFTARGPHVGISSSAAALTIVPVPIRLSSPTVLFYRNEESDSLTTTATATPPAPTTQSTKLKKPTIYPISSLLELQDFLEEDDERLTAIQFVAPWCKTCRHLGLHYRKLAIDYGDVVVDRHAQDGQVRFATVEYTDVTARFIQEQLQIQAVPTLQLYKGKVKVWESSKAGEKCDDDHPPTVVGGGKGVIKNTMPLKREIQSWLELSSQEQAARLEQVHDDGILEEAIEDSFFDDNHYAVF